MKKISLLISALVILTISLTALVNVDKSSQSQNAFKEVEIGEQIWMTKNLNVDTFQNGDKILQAKSKKEWIKACKEYRPVWCYYDYDPENGEKYGKIYNFYAISNARKLAPEGWHIPSDEEWSELIDYLRGSDYAANKMKSTSGWSKNGNGTNKSGFTALPSGQCSINGTTYSLNKHAAWWSSTSVDNENVWCRLIGYKTDAVFRYIYLKNRGLSIRCVKD